MANDHIADDRKNVRLIDANAAIKAMNAVDIHFWEDAEDGVEKCVNILHNAPTVSAVEVVRCGECIHRRYVDMGDEIGAIGGCGLFGTPMMTCNDFCSYGERGTE